MGNGGNAFGAKYEKATTKHVLKYQIYLAVLSKSSILVTKTMKRVIHLFLLCYLAEVTGKIHVEVRMA